MKTKELISTVAKSLSLTKKQTSEVVSSVVKTISEALEKGEKVQISGFLKIDVRKRKARICKNPSRKCTSGSMLNIPASTYPRAIFTETYKKNFSKKCKALN